MTDPTTAFHEENGRLVQTTYLPGLGPITRDAGPADELEEEPYRFSAGWNVPGYLPECDVETFATRDDAAAYLADELERVADGWASLTPEEIGASAEELAEALESVDFAKRDLLAGEDSATIPNAIGSAHDLGCHYWVSENGR